jgi:hypothetical protein
MARADDERPKSPPPLPPASDAVDSAAGADVVPLPPTPKAAGEPAAAPDRERRRKKKADPLHLDVDDAAPLKRNSSQGDLPGVYAAGAGGTARSRAESDNVPHAPPAAVVLESHAAAASAGQMSDKRQFLSNFLRSGRRRRRLRRWRPRAVAIRRRFRRRSARV